jgi:hypothetical protein
MKKLSSLTNVSTRLAFMGGCGGEYKKKWHEMFIRHDIDKITTNGWVYMKYLTTKL